MPPEKLHTIIILLIALFNIIVKKILKFILHFLQVYFLKFTIISFDTGKKLLYNTLK